MQKKKLLGSTLALAMVLTVSQANAELLKGLKFAGQLDLQGTAAKNVTDFATRAAAGGAANNDRVGDMQTRVLLHGMWDVLDDVHAMVTLRKNDRAWGNAGGGANANGSQTLQAPAAGTVIGNIAVDQAYVKIDKLIGGVDTTFGRQFYGESGDMVVFFGPSDKAAYGLPVSALDAARFDWSNDMVGLTGVAAKQVSSGLGVAVAPAAVDLQGINVALKGHENLSAAAYLYRQLTHNIGALGTPPSTAGAGGLNTNLYVAGVKAKAMLGSAAWVGVELAKNFGTQRQTETAAVAGSRNFTGMAFKADAGLKAELAGIGALMPWLHFGYGTGDMDTKRTNHNGFQAIAGDYRPGTIAGRFSAAFSGVPIEVAGSVPGTGGGSAVAGNGTLTNRVNLGGGIKVSPGAWQKLTIGVSVWNFRSQTAALPIAQPSGQRPFNGNKNIGTEADLDLTWKHSDNVTVGAGVASFQPGGVIKEAIRAGAGANAGAGSNPAQLGYFDVRVKWGN